MRISDWSSDVCSSDLVGGFPRHDKYRQALLDCPANEAFFGAEVENIIAIYPRRKDDDWRFQHVLRHRLILNELIQRRFLDDLARRSEEHTSELQSLMRRLYAVFCLKKKTSPHSQDRKNTVLRTQ